METVAKIRRAYFVQQKPIKQICRELRVSRKVVRKVIRSEATAFRYTRAIQPAPKLGSWRDELDRMLLANASKARRERLTLTRVYEALRDLGYEGGYDTVRRYAKGWKRERTAVTAQAFVPLSFAPGEAYQFDWSHETVLIGGTTTEIKVAHVRLCHARMPFVRAYPRESQEMVFDAHDRAFAFFRGACQRGIYDNMKTAVDAIFVGRERAYNRRFLQMCSHYLAEPVACTPASGWEKGQVENRGRTGARASVHATHPGEELRRVERPAARRGDRLRQGPHASRAARPDRVAGLRGRAGSPSPLRRPLRRLPCRASGRVLDLLGSLRQQPVLGHSLCPRAAGRGARLC
ncbi:IS21 family transposase [Methylobacterium tardum]|uniref:IS21 family transposase n=1 Tax=Methylobacterium tardum TaxID=374432 RepID=UPI002021A321|nr:IS21 family transposase [Methylobacterium tardum]URD36093.1 IS21 family transposase [Methylobacterium tardum]